MRYLYTFTWALVIIGLGFLGYFAFTRLSNDFVYETIDESETDTLLVVSDENATPEETVTITQEDITPEEDSTPEVETQEGELKYPDLTKEVEKLVDDFGGLMKKGSQGARVGTLQRFLNVYNGKDINSGVDNDYGPGTAESVKKFQSAEGLGADGQAGPGTFKAMLEWLEAETE